MGLERYLKSPESLIGRVNEVSGIDEYKNLTVEPESSSGTLCRSIRG
jgi:hypothetical protein